MLTNTATAPALDCAPPLTAKLAPWMRKLIDSPSSAAALLEPGGSPVHVVVAGEFRRNVKDLLSPLKERGLPGGLFFARKANKLPWFVALAAEEHIGVDTGSLSELRETLRIHTSPSEIIVTAIGKGRELISEAVGNGCLIVIDNDDEMELVRQVAQAQGRSARIGIRFSGFVLNGRIVFSRFGFPIADCDELIAKISSDSSLKLELLHAHLDRYDIDERAAAARQLLAVADRASSIGVKISGIDLGGGILMRYLESASQWTAFQKQLVDSVAGKRPSFTYLNDGLGYYKVADEVLGKADLYPAWNDISKERFVAAILDHRKDGIALHKEISDRGLKLFFEPGRALLDNTGVTLARVVFRKRDTAGSLLVGAAMNRTNLRPFRAEFCCDPLLLTEDCRQHAPVSAFIVGNLCSESDLIFRRRIGFTCMPKPEDIVLFPNSAGYLAHFVEVGTHGDPLPANFLIDEQTLEIKDQFERSQ